MIFREKMQQSDKVQLINDRLKQIDDLVIRACIPKIYWDGIIFNAVVYESDDLNSELAKKARDLYALSGHQGGYLGAVVPTSLMFTAFFISSIVGEATGLEKALIIFGPLAAISGVVAALCSYKLHSVCSESNQMAQDFWKARKDDIVQSCGLPTEQDSNQPFEVKVDESTIMPLSREIKKRGQIVRVYSNTFFSAT